MFLLKESKNYNKIVFYGENMKLKYTAQQYIEFFRDYLPSFEREGNGKANYSDTGDWGIFTSPTQWRKGFSSYEDAVEYCMDFIIKGNWKPEETSFGRMIHEIEKENLVWNDIK